MNANIDSEANDLLKEIYINYKSYIYKLAYSYLRDKSASEDVIHETILKIRTKIQKKEITKCNKLGPLIVYIVRGICINKIKKDQKVIYREIFDNEIGEEEKEIEKFFINDAINRLPEKYRDVFILNFVKNMKYKEIADKLNLTESAVGKRLERARKMILELWEGDDYEK